MSNALVQSATIKLKDHGAPPWGSVDVSGAIVVFDFAGGDTPALPSKNLIGFTFNNQTWPIAQTHTGRDGLRFRYGPDLAGEDSSSELRFELNSEHFETYEEITLYFPTNFTHRSLMFLQSTDDLTNWQIGDTITTNDGGLWGELYSKSGTDFYLINAGTRISPSWDTGRTIHNTTRTESVVLSGSGSFGQDNKFSHMWQGDYPTNGMDLEYSPDDSTSGAYPGSYFTLKATATDSTPQTSNYPSSTVAPYALGLPEEKGMEVKYTIRRKRATGVDDNNGIVEVWKDGVLAYQKENFKFYDSANNFFERGYLMGWSNSGFEEQTDLIVTKYSFYGSNRPEGLT